MRYPNLRYGNPAEFRHYALGLSPAKIARMLRRDERTVRDWLSTRRRVPWWVPEVMRLWALEAAHMHRQMEFSRVYTRLGVVTGDVIELARPKAQAEKKPQSGGWRLLDDEPVKRQA